MERWFSGIDAALFIDPEFGSTGLGLHAATAPAASVPALTAADFFKKERRFI
jgi:hypothetical protein